MSSNKNRKIMSNVDDALSGFVFTPKPVKLPGYEKIIELEREVNALNAKFNILSANIDILSETSESYKDSSQNLRNLLMEEILKVKNDLAKYESSADERINAVIYKTADLDSSVEMMKETMNEKASVDNLQELETRISQISEKIEEIANTITGGNFDRLNILEEVIDSKVNEDEFKLLKLAVENNQEKLSTTIDEADMGQIVEKLEFLKNAFEILQPFTEEDFEEKSKIISKRLDEFRLEILKEKTVNSSNYLKLNEKIDALANQIISMASNSDLKISNLSERVDLLFNNTKVDEIEIDTRRNTVRIQMLENKNLETEDKLRMIDQILVEINMLKVSNSDTSDKLEQKINSNGSSIAELDRKYRSVSNMLSEKTVSINSDLSKLSSDFSSYVDSSNRNFDELTSKVNDSSNNHMRIVDLEGDISNVNRDVSFLKDGNSERIKLAATVSNQGNELSTLRSRILKLNETVPEDLMMKLSNLEKNDEETSNKLTTYGLLVPKISDLISSNADLSIAVAKLNNDYKITDGRLDGMDGRIKFLQELIEANSLEITKVTDIISIIEGIAANYSRYETGLQVIKNDLDSLRPVVEENSSSLSGANVNIDELKEMLTALESNTESNFLRIDQDITALKEESKQTERQLLQHIDDEKLHGVTKEDVKVVSDLVVDLSSSTQTKVDSLWVRVNEVDQYSKNNTTEFIEEFKEQYAKNGDFENDILVLTEGLQSMNETGAEYETKINNLKSSILSNTEGINSVRVDMGTLANQSDIDYINTELTNIFERIGELENMSDSELSQKVEALISSVRQLSTRVDSVKTESETNILAVNTRISNLPYSQEINNLKTKIQMIEEKLANGGGGSTSGEILVLTTKLNNFIASSTSSTDQLIEQLSEQNATLQSYGDRLTELENNDTTNPDMGNDEITYSVNVEERDGRYMFTGTNSGSMNIIPGYNGLQKKIDRNAVTFESPSSTSFYVQNKMFVKDLKTYGTVESRMLKSNEAVTEKLTVNGTINGFTIYELLNQPIFSTSIDVSTTRKFTFPVESVVRRILVTYKGYEVPLSKDTFTWKFSAGEVTVLFRGYVGYEEDGTAVENAPVTIQMFA